MNYADSPVCEPIRFERIVVDLDGNHGAIRPDQDAIRIGLPEGGYQALLGWFRDRQVYATITGPYFSRFERRAEQYVEDQSFVMGIALNVSYELEIPKPIDALRYEAEIADFASQHSWERSWRWHAYRNEYGNTYAYHVQRDQLQWVTWFCGGLPGEHKTVEVPERERWH